MPTYEYACKSCGNSLEVVQKFTDDPLTKCPECGGVLRKVFGSVGISFKGSGFYKTDSRSGSGSGSGSGSAEKSGSDAKPDSGASSTSSSGDSASTPKTDSSGSKAAS